MINKAKTHIWNVSRLQWEPIRSKAKTEPPNPATIQHRVEQGDITPLQAIEELKKAKG